MAATSVNFKEALQQSREWEGGLGALIWTLRAALRQGGASEENIQTVTQILNDHLQQISAQDRNEICKVLERRLFEDKVSETNSWY